MFVRYGLGDELQDRITQYQRALHDLGVSIDMATRSGQTAAAQQLRAQFNALKTEVDRLVGQKREQEMPSSLSLGIANIGETLARSFRNVAVVAALGIGAVLLAPTLLGAVSRRRRR